MVRYASAIDGLNYVVPEGVTRIQRSCFEGAVLDTVTLKGEGLVLEAYALRCSYKHLIISEGVKELGDYSSCPSEDAIISLPASLSYVGNQGIIDSDNIVEIKVAEGNEYYKCIDGVLYSIIHDDTLSLHKYPGGKTDASYTTPEQAEKINWCAIRGNDYLKDVTVSSGIKEINGGGISYLKDATVTIQNPDCIIASGAFEYCTNLTLKGAKGSAAFTYAKENGINFICIGEDLGKMSSPTNIRWDGTKVKWDPIEGARYNVKFYRNESGSWYHVYSEDKVITDGTCEMDYKSLMWYKDAGYKITISASKVGYDDSDEAESPVASGLFNRGTFDSEIDGDTILAQFDIGDNTDYSWFSYYVTFYDDTDTLKYGVWFNVSSKNEYPNLRELLASKDAPYGKYKVNISKNIEYYGWTVGIAGANAKVEYDYQPIPKVIKVEMDIPEPVHGAPAACIDSLKVKTYCGETVLDALGKSTQYYENCYQYKEDDSSSWTGCGWYDDIVKKGKYQYAYYLILNAKKGYEISEDIQLFINGEYAKDRIIEKTSSSIKLRYEFPIGTKAYEYIDTVTVTGDYTLPKAGEDIKDPENVQVAEEGLSVREAYWITKDGSDWKNEKVTGKFEAGKEYAIYVDIKADEENDFRFADSLGTIAVFGDCEAICDQFSMSSTSLIKVIGKPEAEPTPTPTTETTTTPTAGPDATPAPGTEATPTPGAEITPTAAPDTENVKAPGKVTLKTAKNKKGKKLYVKWDKKKDVAGYEVQYSLKKNFSKAKKAKTKIKSTVKNSITIKKLTRKKNYYVRVRAYKLDSAGNRVYGKWSKVKKVKIKK